MSLTSDPQRNAETRLEALRSYDILDTPEEEAFDRFTRLAADLFDAPFAALNLVDADRQWFKSEVGLSRRETSLDVSFCVYTIESEGPMVVGDATEDPRFAENPAVTGAPGVRFYAGAPLTTEDGHRIGTLCMLDTEPRSFSEADRRQLETLAAMAMDQVERHRDAEELRRAERRYESIFEDLNTLVSLIAPDGSVLDINQTALEYVEEPLDAMRGAPFWETPWWTEETRPMIKQKVRQAAQGEYVTYEAELTRPGGEPYHVEGVIWPVTTGEGAVESMVVSARDVTGRKEREAELRRSRDLLRHTEELAEVGGWEADLTTGAQRWTLGTRRIHGVGEDFDPTVESGLAFYHPEDQGAIRAAVRRCAEEWTPYDLELRFIRADGAERWVRTNGERIRGGDGNAKLRGAIQDITEPKKAERALRASEQQLRGIANSVPGVLYQFYARPGGDWGHHYVSENAKDILGLDPSAEDLFEQITGRVVEGHREAFLASIEEATRQESFWNREFPYEKPSGERIWLHAVSYPEQSNGELIFNGLLLDITERKEAERGRRLLARAVEEAGEAVLITEAAPLDPPGPRIEYANPAFERMTGYDREEIVGETPRLLQGPETDRDVLDDLRASLEAGEPWNGETINYRKDGTPYVTEWTAAPVRGEEGQIERWVSVQRDVTEDREREKALRAAKEEAEAAAQLKEAMLANMSHEVRTPLTAMIGYAGMLQGDLEGPKAEFVDLIYEGGRRLQETLDGMLSLSKLEGGAYELRPERVDLGNIARQVVGELAPRAQKQGVEVETQLPRAAEGRWDENALRRVLRNLLENAIKFTPEGGHAEVRAWLEEGEATLEVEDTGIGIAEDVQEAVFTPFKQESAGYTREYEGTGLGLAIVQEFVELMDGTIELESTKGQGTRFTVRLPRQ